MTTRTNSDSQPAASAMDGTTDHMEAMLLADLRALLELDRTTTDKALVDRVVVELAAARAKSVSRILEELIATLNLADTLHEAARAAAQGQVQ